MRNKDYCLSIRMWPKKIPSVTIYSSFYVRITHFGRTSHQKEARNEGFKEKQRRTYVFNGFNFDVIA